MKEVEAKEGMRCPRESAEGTWDSEEAPLERGRRCKKRGKPSQVEAVSSLEKELSTKKFSGFNSRLRL